MGGLGTRSAATALATGLFFWEGLWVSHTVPYHPNYLLTSLPQLCVGVFYSEALWQRAIFGP